MNIEYLKGRRGITLLGTVVLLGVAGYMLLSGARTRSTGEKDEITLVCAKCAAESQISTSKFRALAHDDQSKNYACPKCGVIAAQEANSRCPSCARAFPAQPMGSELVCPYCKASLLPEGWVAE